MYYFLILIISYSCVSYAEDTYKLYDLLDGSVQVVLPSYPKEVDLSGVPMLKRYNAKKFVAIDYVNEINYFLSVRDFHEEKDVGYYNHEMKDSLDNQIKTSFEMIYDGVINDFSSVFDRKNNFYKADFSGTILIEGDKFNKSSIYIVNKHKIYDLVLIYRDIKNKNIFFDKYKNDFKVLK